MRWLALLVLVLSTAGVARAQVAVTTNRYNPSRTASNLSETVLTTSNVVAGQFGKLGTYLVDGVIYAQPLYVPGVTFNGAVYNVLYVVTMHNVLYAFDADHVGSAPLWSVDFRTMGYSPFALYSGDGSVQGAADAFGIFSTPVIDLPNNRILFVTTSNSGGGFTSPVTCPSCSVHFNLWSYDIRNGARLAGPFEITGTNAAGQAFGPNASEPTWAYGQRPALELADGQIWIGFGSRPTGDTNPWAGWLFTYDATTFVQTGVFAASTSGASIWQSGMGPAVDASGNVYLTTGNGGGGVPYDGVRSFQESLLKFDFGSSLNLLDWYTPDNPNGNNWQTMDNNDQDLTNSGPMLIPGTDLIVHGDKTGDVTVAHIGNLGHLTPNDTQLAQFFHVGAPITDTSNDQDRIVGMAFWPQAGGGTLYVWPGQDTLHAYSLNTSTSTFTQTYAGTLALLGDPSTALALSANGTTVGTGILWAPTQEISDGFDPAIGIAGVLHAYNASNPAQELWNSDQVATDKMGTLAKFVPPTVVNGKVYIANSASTSNYPTSFAAGSVTVYGLFTPPTPAAQTINFPVPATQTVGVTLTLGATASSGLAVVYSSTTSGVCTVSGSVATFLAAGTCSLTANQAGNASYLAAPAVTQSFSVTAASAPSALLVSLTAPLTGANLTVGSASTLTATVSDPNTGASVRQVSFYAGSALIGTSTSQPFSVSWTPATAGPQLLTAVATDSVSATGTSPALSVTVNAASAGSLAGVAGAWSFDAVSGTTVTDNSGNGHTLNLGPGVASTSVGLNGSALKFSGQLGATLGTGGAYATGPVLNTSGSFSVSAWVNFGSFANCGMQTVASQDGNTVSGFYLQVLPTCGGNTQIRFALPASDADTAATASAVGTTVPVTGTWYHLVGVKNAATGQLQLYVNGVLQGTASAPASWSAGGKFVLGRGKFSAGERDAVTGTIDGAEVFNTALTAANVTTLYKLRGAVGSLSVPPTVSITAPAAGASVAVGSALTVTAAASDPNSGASVTQVSFYDGAVLLGKVTTAPFGLAWSPTAVGAHSLTAVATDSLGLTATSAAVGVTVTSQPLVVSLTSPASGTIVPAGGAVSLTAAATDPNTGGSIMQVRFYDGSTLLGTTTAAPFGYNWVGAAVGNHTLTATATDNLGVTGSSSAVTLTVSTAPLVVALTSPGNGTSVSAGSALALTATVSDPNPGATITSVKFLDGGTVLASVTTAPFTYSWTPTTAGPHSLTVSATDSLGATGISAAVSVTVTTATAPPAATGAWSASTATATTVGDDSGNGHVLSFGPGVSVTSAGVSGPGLKFSGQLGATLGTGGAYATGPVLNTSGSFSVSAWVNFGSFANCLMQTLVSQDGNTVSGFYLQVLPTCGGNTQIRFSLPASDADTAATASAVGTTVPVTGTWYHLVGVKNAATGQLQLYVNGVLQGTASAPASWSAGGKFVLGRGKFSAGERDAVTGTIDSVEVFNSALTAAQVSALYTAK